jgi:uncharacterized protein
VTGENREANARQELASARDALKVARAALALEIPRDAMSRAYYAAFHAVRALLLTEGVEPKSHAGLVRLFGEHWIRPGKLPTRDNLLLTRMGAYRQASDYSYGFPLGMEETGAEIECVAEFVDRIAVLVESTLGAIDK